MAPVPLRLTVWPPALTAPVRSTRAFFAAADRLAADARMASGLPCRTELGLGELLAPGVGAATLPLPPLLPLQATSAVEAATVRTPAAARRRSRPVRRLVRSTLPMKPLSVYPAILPRGAGRAGMARPAPRAWPTGGGCSVAVAREAAQIAHVRDLARRRLGEGGSCGTGIGQLHHGLRQGADRTGLSRPGRRRHLQGQLPHQAGVV